MSMDHLFKAMGMFTDGMQQLAINRGINSATEEVNALKTAEMDEMQKRAKQEAIARQLAAQLTTAGASGQHIQTAMSAVAPEQIKNSADAYSIAARTGDKSVQAYADTLYGAEQKPAVEQQGRAFSQASTLSAQGYQQQRELNQQMIDAGKFDRSGKSDLKPLTSVDTKKIDDLNSTIAGADDLLSRFKFDPKLQGAVGLKNRIPGVEWFRAMNNTDFADFKAQVGQDFDKYRQAITGAGASTGEINLLMKNRPTMEDTPEAFEKKFKTILRLAHQRRGSFLETQGRAKRDISGFEDQMLESKEKGRLKIGDDGLKEAMDASSKPPQGVDPNARLELRMNKRTGQYEKLWVQPDGQAFKE